MLARFSPDSDHSSRWLTPQFFSNATVNSTSFSRVGLDALSGERGKLDIFGEKERVQSQINLDVAARLPLLLQEGGPAGDDLHGHRLLLPGAGLILRMVLLDPSTT